MKKENPKIDSIYGPIRSIFLKSKYKIRRGYFHRTKYNHFTDVNNKDEWQKEVYEYAEQIARKNNYKKIIDIGCGSGYKLLKHFGEGFEITGLEIEDTLEYLKNNYPDHTWLDSYTTDFSSLNAELIIISDVIEHVVDPDKLINNLRKIKHSKLFIISTPDRLILRNRSLRNKYGPARNKAHAREWTGDEFKKYIESQKFIIHSHQISNYKQATQLITCSFK